VRRSALLGRVKADRRHPQGTTLGVRTGIVTSGQAFMHSTHEVWSAQSLDHTARASCDPLRHESGELTRSRRGGPGRISRAARRRSRGAAGHSRTREHESERERDEQRSEVEGDDGA